MSISEGSSSRIIRHRVSSDEYFEVKLNELGVYSSLYPSSYIVLPFRKRSCLNFSSSLLFVKIKNSDMAEILKKVEKCVTSSGEDMGYKLKKMFEKGKKNGWLGIEPGTVRIYSNELICYYTGKNWKKFKTK